MPAIEVGRVCIKTAGREAGQKCVTVEIIDEKFVEVVGGSIKNRRCNIKHLVPTTQSLELKSDDASLLLRVIGIDILGIWPFDF